MPHVPPFLGNPSYQPFQTNAEIVAAPRCSVCGTPQTAVEVATEECGNCKLIRQQTEERHNAALAVAEAARHATYHVYSEAVLRDPSIDALADALDHYIARSSQGWVR